MGSGNSGSQWTPRCQRRVCELSVSERQRWRSTNKHFPLPAAAEILLAREHLRY